MVVRTDEQAIDRLLNLGVTDVIVKEDLKNKLKSGRKLRVKLGIDPTGFELHLGHMVVVHKLREFQDLGHQIILLFGNFTGQIGDPSGKLETRPLRTQEELEKNAEHYLKQVSKLLDVKKLEIRWNAEWLSKLSFADVVKLASQFTVAQMLERDMFQERVKNDLPISMHEFLYPLMQGYDSVALEADVELGGTDQTFNLLAGRVLQRAYGQESQNLITVPILVGTDGVMKMGKTTKNYIGVDEAPEMIYGKTMSIPDDLILDYFELAARASAEELLTLKERLNGGNNPMDLKMELARQIVELYHGPKDAKKAEEHFKNLFQKKELPKDIEESFLHEKKWNILDLLVELRMVSSKNEARRLIEGGGLRVNEEKVQEVSDTFMLSKTEGLLIQAGKFKFRKVFLKP